MDTRRQLARSVRDARIERGLTQADVARALGLHRPAVSEIEAGRRAVSSEELLELSRLFSVSASDLLPSSPGSSLITSEAPPPETVAPARLDSASLHLPAADTSRADATGIDATIAEMARVIADLFAPEQIRLFGSHARGSPGPDSDVDLLVVMHVEGSRRRMGARIGAALHRFEIPKDVTVITPRAFAERRNVPGTIERSAAVEGKVLHAAHDADLEGEPSMPPDGAVLEVVRGWVAKAEADLENARLVLEAGPAGPLDTAAFHAQQCAEKYLKAFMCARGGDVPRMHDVEALLARTGIHDQMEVTVEESRLLTDYATVTRYPGDYEPVGYDEARHAVELARRIRSAVRMELPEGVVGEA